MRLLINAVLVVCSLVVAFVLLNGAATLYFGRSLEGSYHFYAGDRLFNFDPVSGYRLPRAPTLIARITNGDIEYVAPSSGNNRGFPSRDFNPERLDNRQRFAVFGDSFTHANYLTRNWPAYVEDHLAFDQPTELLNFALNGSGLANWWSILKYEIEPSGYQLDGVIFAVFEDDLFRPFTMAHTDSGKFRLGRLSFWDPARFPKTLAEATPYMPQIGPPHYILDEPQFMRALSGDWRPVESREWYATRQFRELSAPKPSASPPAPPSPDAQKWRSIMIADIAAAIRQHGWKAIVVYLPARPDLLGKEDGGRYRNETQRFAREIGATFYDSTELYKGMAAPEIRAHFLPYDGHWNLAGSDLLGKYVVGILKDSGNRRSVPLKK